MLLMMAAACTGVRSGPALASPRTWHFDDLLPGALPRGFTVDARRGGGAPPGWGARPDVTAPSTPNMLSLHRMDHSGGDTFNLCWTDAVGFGDGTLAVRLRAMGGQEDQGGGLLWRARDRDNCYFARLNPLANNLRLYCVEGGNRTMLASAEVDVPTGSWNELRIDHRGSHITVSLDGKQLLEAHDDTFTGPGGIGMWTKADATTDFDDLRVEPSI